MKTKTKAAPEIRTEPVQGVRGEGKAGPLQFVNAEALVEHEGRHYRVVIYGAYNAGGIIGPELNGIGVLCEDDKTVVADNICRENSGYFGPSRRQVEEWRRIVEADTEEFKKTVNSSPRLRYSI